MHCNVRRRPRPRSTKQCSTKWNIAMKNPVIEAIERQKTTNLYDASKSIPDDKIRELVRLATFSPTSFHLQNWRFIAVRSPEAKARLRAVAADQPKVTEAAVTFIMVGELAVSCLSRWCRAGKPRHHR